MIIAIEWQFKAPHGISTIIFILPLPVSLITHKGYIRHHSVSFKSSAAEAVKPELLGTKSVLETPPLILPGVGVSLPIPHQPLFSPWTVSLSSAASEEFTGMAASHT